MGDARRSSPLVCLSGFVTGGGGKRGVKRRVIESEKREILRKTRGNEVINFITGVGVQGGTKKQSHLFLLNHPAQALQLICPFSLSPCPFQITGTTDHPFSPVSPLCSASVPHLPYPRGRSVNSAPLIHPELPRNKSRHRLTTQPGRGARPATAHPRPPPRDGGIIRLAPRPCRVYSLVWIPLPPWPASQRTQPGMSRSTWQH